METALKLARAYHLARGEPERTVIVARHLSYHGNTRGALDASGRPRLRAPYEPWLGHAVHVPAVTEYRCPAPGHPAGCGAWHAAELERTFSGARPRRVAAFIAEPIGGATTGAAVPTDDYWPAVAEVCRRHGVLLIADEVMTGFGRTGAWFAIDHWGVEPDIMVAAKGASSGYWPLGLCVASGEVHQTVLAGGRLRARAHLLPPSRGGGGGPGGAAAHPGTGPGGGVGGPGPAAAGSPCRRSARGGHGGRHPRPGPARRRRVGRRPEHRRALPAGEADHRASGGGRPPPGPARLLLEGLRRRGGRRRGGARAPAHHHARRRSTWPPSAWRRRWPRWLPEPIDALRGGP